MAEYPYTTVPGKISNLLSKIREVGVPQKATQQWLKTVGFASSNDPSLLTVLRFIGLVDASSVPTDAWRSYRGAQHGQVLANAIRQGYSEFFAVYPDAHARSASEIENVVSTSSTAGKQAITKTIRTFQNLCAAADFTAAGEVPLPPAPDAGAAAGIPPGVPPSVIGTSVPSLHIEFRCTSLQMQVQNKSIRFLRAWLNTYIKVKSNLDHEKSSKGRFRG